MHSATYRESRFALVSVELVAEKDPAGLRIGIDRLSDMGDKVGFGPSILDGWGEHFPSCQVQIGRYHLRAVSDVIEFPPLGQARLSRQRCSVPLDCLHPRFLINADRVDSGRFILLCGSRVQRADFLDLGSKLVPISNVGMFKVTTAVWL
jgi:hypothetical protein